MSIEQMCLLDRKPVVWRPTSTLPEFQHPGREPWSPTPGRFANIDNPEIAKNQALVRFQAQIALHALYFRPSFANPENDSYVPGLHDFVETVYESREAERGTNNANSFNDMLCDLDDIDPKLKDKLESARFGSAQPGEILELIDGLGMGSAELAKITHIWGYRLEYLKDMREQVKQAIQDKFGEVYTDPVTKYGIIAIDKSTFNGGYRLNAIAMKRKTLIGQVDNTAVYERTTFIVRIDRNSHINHEVALYLKSINSDNTSELIERIMQDGRLVDEAKQLVAIDDLDSVVPMSTTIFGCNDVNLGLLETRRQAIKLQEKNDNDAMSPELKLHCEQRRFGAVAIPLSAITD